MTKINQQTKQNYRSYGAQCEHYLARPHQGTPAGPIASAAAWRGAEVAKTSDWRVVLTAKQVDEIECALAHGKSTGKPLAAWTVGDFPLPDLSAEVALWRDEIKSGKGFVLLSGLPVGRWSLEESERFFWALGLHLGIPGAQNPEGDLLGSVINTGNIEDDPMVRLYQTQATIAYHCDAADVVGLLCLQSALSGGASRIASSVTVWNELYKRRPDLALRLFDPVHVDLRNEQVPGTNPWNVLTPCTFADGRLYTFYHSDYFRSVERHKEIDISKADRELFDLYDDIAHSKDICLDMQLEPGDVQLVSNHTIIHARTGYEDTPERKRHLLRLWISL